MDIKQIMFNQIKKNHLNNFIKNMLKEKYITFNKKLRIFKDF